MKVTIVEPGYFRTNFLESGSLRTPESQLDNYTLVRESEALHQQQIKGSQSGDPVKAVAAIIQVAARPNPPLHPLLGQDVYDTTNVKIKALQDDMAQWKEVTVATGFAEPATT